MIDQDPVELALMSIIRYNDDHRTVLSIRSPFQVCRWNCLRCVHTGEILSCTPQHMKMRPAFAPNEMMSPSTLSSGNFSRRIPGFLVEGYRGKTHSLSPNSKLAASHGHLCANCAYYLSLPPLRSCGMPARNHSRSPARGTLPSPSARAPWTCHHLPDQATCSRSPGYLWRPLGTAQTHTSPRYDP